jgi:hypothetical protein
MNRAGAMRTIVVAVGFFFTAAIFPAQWAGRDAAAWARGDISTQLSLARTVLRQTSGSLKSTDFLTGSDLFSGEWLFGTYLMAGIGFCQIALEHPKTRRELLPGIARCVHVLLTPEVRAFDHDAWREDALDTLDGPHGHAAYLGYLNLLLALYEQVDPGNEFVPLHNHITSALYRHIQASPNGLIETYPTEWYPMDNAPVLASLALSPRLVDAAAVDALVARYRQRCLDPRTGLLIQALGPDGGAVDVPRGSGSALASFFFIHGLPALADDLYAAIRHELAVNVAGFGAIREYPHGNSGASDIDSGPVIFGLGASASGFSIGPARFERDSVWFRRLFATAWFAGAPLKSDHQINFLSAGPLGNAILLAMLTAPQKANP